MLTKGQRIALQALESGRNVFLSGEAGTGKSYVLNQFLAKNTRKNILVCAPTGIAAINVNGSTLHRVFGVPIEPIGPTKNPMKTSETVQKADIIIIDEISMCRFDCFEYVAKAIKLAEKEAQNKEYAKAEKLHREPITLPPKQLIVVGDFFQLPPVITDKDRPVLENYWGRIMNVGDGFAFQAPMWSTFDFVTIVLDEVMRQKGDLDFVANLNCIRRGDKSAIAWFNAQSAQKVQKGIHLCSTNKAAEQINLQEAAKLKGFPRTYTADITGIVNASDKPTSDALTLKKGMQVMSLINDPENRYQNGSLGIITDLDFSGVEVDFGGQKIEISKHSWDIIDYQIIEKNGESKVEKTVIGIFRQLPLKIAYAITMHKSQGQTYDAANIHPSCFASGQLYVALSRIKSIKSLYLTKKIQPENLITAEAVLNFYDHAITSYEPLELETVTEPKPTKTTHGGTRAGAGRKKKYGGETCTIRIPVSAKEAVQEFLASREWP